MLPALEFWLSHHVNKKNNIQQHNNTVPQKIAITFLWIVWTTMVLVIIGATLLLFAIPLLVGTSWILQHIVVVQQTTIGDGTTSTVVVPKYS